MVNNNSENSIADILSKLLESYPEIWNEHIKFKALLKDFLPQDRLRRNLLCICLEEGIPQGLISKENISNIQFAIYKEKLINACGCSELLASEILSFWVDALGVKVADVEKINSNDLSLPQYLSISINDLELSVRSYNILKRAGILNVKQILDLKGDEFVSIPLLNIKNAEEIVKELEEQGVPFEATKHLHQSITEKKAEKAEKKPPLRGMNVREGRGDPETQDGKLTDKERLSKFYIKYNNQWTKSRRVLGEYYYEIVQDKKEATAFDSERKARSMMGLLKDTNEIEEGFEVVEESCGD